MPKTPHLLLLVVLAGNFPLNGQQTELRSLANSLSRDIAAAGKKSIAVVDFTDLQGNPSELGRFLAEEFSVALARTHKGFEVIERNHLKAILSEHKLAATGLIDPATAKKLGQFAGADAIVTGSMTPFSESVRVAVKVLATDTARIITADDVDLPKTKTIAELLATGIGSKGGNSANYQSPAGGLPSPSLPSPDPVQRPAASSPTRPSPSSPVVVVEEFQYELIECRGMGNSVRCSFRITNRGSDRTLVLFCGRRGYGSAPTRAYDNFGNESAGESCAVANSDSTSGLFAGVSVSMKLISGIPVQASILFSTVGASASTLSLITIQGTSLGGRPFDVSFRNVPIAR